MRRQEKGLSTKMKLSEYYRNKVRVALEAAPVLLGLEVNAFVSVGEVARVACVSQPTARKHLEALYKEGVAKSIGRKNTGYFYRIKQAKASI